MMQFMSVKQTSEKWSISTRRIQILCKQDRIPRVMRVGYSWVIPADAKKPSDARVNNGKYVRRKETTGELKIQ